MKAFNFFLKAIFLTLTLTTFYSCTETVINDEIGLNDTEKLQTNKGDIKEEDVQEPN